jgi:uncharacterized protein YjbI with pentapeptide repeats
MAINARKDLQEAEERVNIKMEKIVDEIKNIHNTMHGVSHQDQLVNHPMYQDRLYGYMGPPGLVFDCQLGFYKQEITYELDRTPIYTTICSRCPDGYRCDGNRITSVTSETKLRYTDLAGRDFAGAAWKDADLTGANLKGTALDGADLNNATLTDTDLRGADLTGARIAEANLTGANLTEADLTGADLTLATLNGIDLTGCTLTGALGLGTAMWEYHDLPPWCGGSSGDGADGCGFELGPILRNVKAAYTNWSTVHGGVLVYGLGLGLKMRHADFRDADFTGANLTGADLIGGYMIRADFTGANLTYANCSEADLTGANLTDADLTGAKFDGANLTDAIIGEDVLRGATLTGATLSRLLYPSGDAVPISDYEQLSKWLGLYD